MGRLIAAILSIAMLGAAKPELFKSITDLRGWSVVERPGVCLLNSSDSKIAFATADGRSIAIVSPGALGGSKTFNVDGGTVEAIFHAEGGLIIASASDDILVKLLQSSRIVASWPDAQVDTSPPEMRSLIDLRRCGSQVSAKKDEARRKEEKRREFWQRLGAAGAAMSDAGANPASNQQDDFMPRSTSVHGSGMMCMKKREWTSGFNKNCVYDCLGSEAVTTIGSVDLCPLTIKR